MIATKFIRTSKKKENEYLWITEILTELELIVDTTEQARERPKDYKKRKKIEEEHRKKYL